MMKIQFRRIRKPFRLPKRGEKGQALVIVLIILLLVSVIATSTAALITESLKTNNTYDYNTISTYSAEAGIQDSICKIENDSENDLINFFQTAPLPSADDNLISPGYTFGTTNPTYGDYYYYDNNNTYRWVYVLPSSPVPTTLTNGTTTTTPVNDQNVNVYMQNVWVPVGISAPTKTTVQQMQANNNLIISGTAGDVPYYDISVTYAGTGTIPLTSIGVWLPQGFSYVAGSSNLASVLPSGGSFVEQSPVPCAGNLAVIWSLSGVNLGSGSTITFSFQYSTSTSNYPTALSWVTDVLNSSFPFSFTWDYSTKVHLITADAGNTTIQCYSPKAETILPAGESGDYYATGSASMMPTNNVAYRDLLLNSSSANTGTSPTYAIPTDAQVNVAYLYWSGWVQNYANGIFWDQCEVQPGSSATLGISPNTVSVPSNWNATGTWSVQTNGQQSNAQNYNAYFQSPTGSSSITLNSNNYVDLSKTTSATISWVQQGTGSGTNTISLKIGIGSGFSSPTTVSVTAPTSSWAPYTYTIPAQYLTSADTNFNVQISHTGTTSQVNLDDISIVDNNITTNYDPGVTLSVTNSSNVTFTNTVTPTGPTGIAWAAPVSSGRTGTLNFTYGSNTVSGTVNNANTSPNGVINGNYIRSNADPNTWYLVTAVTGTSITISPSYAGTSNTSSYYVQDGYYYACKADVTNLVQQHSNIVSPSTSGNGNATYTVSNLFGDTQSQMYNTSTSQNPSGLNADAGFTGWSLVIVYADASTLGHQLYLYDFEASVPSSNNGNPYVINETLNGFIVPHPLPADTTSSDVSKMTAFVGEGDVGLSNDYLAYVDSGGVEHELWDGINCTNNTGSGYNTLTGNSSSSPNNVWNSSFIDQATMQPSTVSGVDIDTFHIKWGENLIQTNDTSANIRLSTNGDGYVLVYMIMSFRSLVTNGGSISYLITRKPNNP
jgi:hypothetical protein